MTLDNALIDKIINRLFQNETRKKSLEQYLQTSTIDILQNVGSETCFNLLFNNTNKLFFNKEEKLYMLERVLEVESLTELVSNKNLNSLPLYLIKPICRGIMEKYPELIINLVKNNSRFEYYVEQCGFTVKEKEYISSIILMNKLD